MDLTLVIQMKSEFYSFYLISVPLKRNTPTDDVQKDIETDGWRRVLCRNTIKSGKFLVRVDKRRYCYR